MRRPWQVRKWGANWVPSMVVQPTGVAYSFLMECPIPSMKSEKKQRTNQRQREAERNRKKKKYTLKGSLHMSQDEGQ